MLGIDLAFYQHCIDLKANAKPMKQQRYKMNPNYVKKAKEELDKLLQVGFIYLVDQVTWLSPIVIVPKKNSSLEYVWTT